MEYPISFSVNLNFENSPKSYENHYYTKKFNNYAIEKLVFNFVASKYYPEESFQFQVVTTGVLTKDEIQEISQKASENKGRSILFEVISLVQENLQLLELAKSEASFPKVLEHATLKEEDDQQLRSVPVFDNERTGTEVTVQTFAVWKAKFESEMGIDYNSYHVNAKFDHSKISGKEFFTLGLDKDVSHLEAEAELLEMGDDLMDDDDDNNFDYADLNTIS